MVPKGFIKAQRLGKIREILYTPFRCIAKNRCTNNCGPSKVIIGTPFFEKHMCFRKWCTNNSAASKTIIGTPVFKSCFQNRCTNNWAASKTIIGTPKVLFSGSTRCTEKRCTYKHCRNTHGFLYCE